MWMCLGMQCLIPLISFPLYVWTYIKMADSGEETFTRIFSHCTKSGRIFRVGCLSVLFVETI